MCSGPLWLSPPCLDAGCLTMWLLPMAVRVGGGRIVWVVVRLGPYSCLFDATRAGHPRVMHDPDNVRRTSAFRRPLLENSQGL